MHRLAILTLAGLASLVATSSAYACTCADRSARQRLYSADEVFLGRFIGQRRSLLSPQWERVTTFEVERVWKGDGRRLARVVTEERTSCGGHFPDDTGRYVVFAYRDRWRRLATGYCTGTVGLANVMPTLAMIGPGRRIKAAKPAPGWLW